jgi:spore photoproduct lyase
MIHRFDTVFVHPELARHPRTLALLERVPHNRVVEIGEIERLERRRGQDPASHVMRGKFNLALAPYRGVQVESCPASPGMSCCRYRVINLVAGCPIDCSYCVLQGYLNRPTITVYPEMEKVFAELEEELSGEWPHPPRYGTGELSDSLALDTHLRFAPELVRFFGKHPGCWFELKTKGASVETILDIDPVPRNVVVSWSVNPQRVIDSEERFAPSLDERLEAARRVRDAGYRLGFHFDPIFRYDGWRDGYREVVEKIYSVAAEGDIAWISLGGLRYSPWMAPYYAERFADHPLLAGELHPVPPDGKYRYPQPVRIELYRALNEWMTARDKEVYVYLCMESPAVFRWALGREVSGDCLGVERGFPPPPGWSG